MQFRPIPLTHRSQPENKSAGDGASTADYDIKEVYSDLQRRLEWLTTQEKLDWLVNEFVRLQEENGRLLVENHQLREELTLMHLAREMELTQKSREGKSLPEIPREARRLFAQLPDSFSFSDFLEYATAEGIENTDAKEYLRAFFRHEMLRNKGHRVEKTGWIPYPVPPIPLKRG